MVSTALAASDVITLRKGAEMPSPSVPVSPQYVKCFKDRAVGVIVRSKHQGVQNHCQDPLVVTLVPQWAESGSRFTLMFEAFAV